jgi:hypothetical protein
MKKYFVFGKYFGRKVFFLFFERVVVEKRNIFGLKRFSP